MKKIFYLLGIVSISAITSCKKEHSGIDESNINKIAPNGFNYQTSKDVSLNLQLLTNGDQPIAGAVVSVYTTASTDAGSAVFKGITDQNGNLKATVNVAASFTQLIIDPSYVGLMHNVRANINNNTITATIGGKSGYSGDIVPDAINNNQGPGGSTGVLGTLGLTSTDYVYPSPYTTTAGAVLNTTAYPLALGRPVYLETTSDVIDASLLSYVNASLPESQSVSNIHPEYLSSSAVSNINVTATSDVWITYVSEGASNQNTLAYYTYNTNNPPTATSGGTNAKGIDKVTMVLPNASGVGSGGGLKSGDKVKLGTFSAGTTIAFVLLQNSWTGSGVNLSTQKFYSDSQLNPESTSALKKHSVVLYDDVHKLYLFGFEDMNRQTASTNPGGGASDNDFNDIVFYATANPITGISNTGIPVIDKAGDSDGDGVLDVYDAFPTDPTRAYIYSFPSPTTFAQLAFEDNWPSKGDYDMNDLVVNYRYTFIANAQTQIVTMQTDFTVAASGASFKNGFGLQLPFDASTVKSVTGQKTISNYIQFASNGVEAGQTKAVIIPFDNHEAIIHNPDYSFFINTLNAKDKVQSVTSSVLVTFNSPVSSSGLSIASFNPFLISNLRRGYEIHLPGYAATDKANAALFGTTDDASFVAGRKSYTSRENWPWALSFNDTSFNYPLETINITAAYPHFTDWAGSGGTSFVDWYSNLTTGYRVNANLYLK
ncbi:LruC domain-containing protein [Mucilaginibacter arboris]|uniref:LruC domain-containing protein n=1 Tax=Mucilaginibacter arboris TaxID=2682090 RepID=A0A7K1T1H5_9SPHI|nr:LruC domain-containing protein [Mucilaginibacter arboris]MVN23433.1 LruC domain-containing protein [Mucilaginibacter arboris]